MNGYDGDGYGDDDDTIVACAQPEGYVDQGGDCDDTDPMVHPGATEYCNGLDNDCDGIVDNDAPTWYRDADGDGYGDPNVSTVSCDQPDGYVDNDLDCYDDNPDAKPGQTDYFTVHRGDGSFDYNCDGTASMRWAETTYCNCGSGGFGMPQGDSRWAEAAPDCGISSTWIEHCSKDGWGVCSNNTSLVTQECR